MTLDEFLKFHAQCDEWIRAGQIEKAQNSLLSIKLEEVPNSRLKDLCNLYRRTHLWKQSLIALKPKVRPLIDPHNSKASAGEKIEYALALQKAGAYRESLNLLNEPEVVTDPQAILAKSFHEIFHWNYGAAAPLLQAYIHSPEVKDYERLIARVNLLACLRFLNNSEMEKEFRKLKAELETAGNQRLLSAVLEIGAQHLIAEHQWQEAHATLDHAEKLMKAANSDLIFVTKWRYIAEALEKKSVEPLDEFRAKALELRHWETLRDLDFFRATLEPTSAWAHWVYFGTPHSSFRERLDKVHSFNDQQIVSRSPHPKSVIDPWFVGDQHGEVSHLLFNLLLRDFYRPMKVGEIFSELFWDGFLDVKSSQNRVHQLMSRLRKWIADSDLPFSLQEIDGAYALRMNADTALLCHKRILPAQKLPFIFGRFEGVPEGSAQEWAERFNVTTVKARNLLTQAIPEGLVLKTGAGQQTRYKLVSK